ncbi:response regulator transcription factor [Bacillus sp. FJAT-49711]|uniref:response regulator transcription factor n=1 Tax=Bacillus sp. FJAT-49711 TaxID=2833585 RepID=UPI001BCA5074|nr:response regulator transcription factor [Bacillus sp. FJAT-49711]MBS4220331.1 response regulator transcription factor [Bacillus sp. FJAT-49711]
MKVVIIDDEVAMHLIMKRMLGKINNVEIIGSFNDTIPAFSFLQNNKVDVVFIDISMPWENGIDFARRLRERDLQIKLIFITSHKEYALPAFDVYAYDYIVKPLSQERLAKTLERIFTEERAAEKEKVEVTSSATSPPFIEPLTKRELEILRLICMGMSNKDIAVNYKLSEGTVKNHVVNIFGKLQVKNRVQATVVAKGLGMMS